MDNSDIISSLNSLSLVCNSLKTSREELCCVISELQYFKTENETNKNKVQELTSENNNLLSKNLELEDKYNSCLEELASLRSVSIIKNMSKQIQDLKNHNQILEKKINYYKSNYDIRTETSSLTGLNFDDIKSNELSDKDQEVVTGEEIIDNNSNNVVECCSNESDTEYPITEHLARLMNIPIERKISCNKANQFVRDYINNNKLHCKNTLTLKYDFKLFKLLNIETTDSVEARDILLKLNKTIKENGLIIPDNSSNEQCETVGQEVIEETKSQDTQQEHISVEELSVNEEGSDEEEDEETFEVTKIGKRYYYVSSVDSSVYKAVRNKKTKEYELGDKKGILVDGKIVKN